MTICWHDIRTLVMDTVIQPDSSLAKWWEIFVLLVTLAIATGYPYVASFFGKGTVQVYKFNLLKFVLQDLSLYFSILNCKLSLFFVKSAKICRLVTGLWFSIFFFFSP